MVSRAGKRFPRPGDRGSRRALDPDGEWLSLVCSRQPHVAGRFARAADDARDLVGVVALDRLDAAVRQHLLDDPDVVVAEDDEVAWTRDDARAVDDRPAGAAAPSSRCRRRSRSPVPGCRAGRRPVAPPTRRSTRTTARPPTRPGRRCGTGRSGPSRWSRAAARPDRPRPRRSARSRSAPPPVPATGWTPPVANAPLELVGERRGARASGSGRRGGGRRRRRRASSRPAARTRSRVARPAQCVTSRDITPGDRPHVATVEAAVRANSRRPARDRSSGV